MTPHEAAASRPTVAMYCATNYLWNLCLTAFPQHLGGSRRGVRDASTTLMVVLTSQCRSSGETKSAPSYGIGVVFLPQTSAGR